MKNSKRKNQVVNKTHSPKTRGKAHPKETDVVINENDIYDVEFQNVEDDTIVFPDCELYDNLPF